MKQFACLGLLAWCVSGCAGYPADYFKSMVAAPQRADLYTLAAEADQAYRESRWLEAATHYEKFLEQVPGDSNAWFRLANIRLQQGEPVRAVPAYLRSIDHDAQQPRTWFNLSTAYLLHAEHAMRSALQLMGPNDPARTDTEARYRRLQQLLAPRIEDQASRWSGPASLQRAAHVRGNARP